MSDCYWRELTKSLTCTECGFGYLARASSHRDRRHCDDCRYEYRILQGKICNKVSKAIRAGKLAPIHTLQCVDCAALGKKTSAEVYDHRSYDAPLVVEPVCKSHNAIRGGAAWTSKRRRKLPTVEAPDCAALSLMGAP